MVTKLFVSPSVSFADSAPLLALRATSPVSGESVSQREPFSAQAWRSVGADSISARGGFRRRRLSASAFGARPSKKSTFFAKPLDVDPQSCYYDSTSFAGLFFMPFFKGACKREGGLLTDNGGAEQ